MGLARVARHLLMTEWQVRRAFPARSLSLIEQAIKRSESGHLGEIRFVVEGALPGRALLSGQSARARAIEVFSQLRIWDTEHNNGILIYLLLADRDVEIVADRGIHAKVGAAAWESICRAMEQAFRQGENEAAVVGGIDAVTQQLTRHFPATAGGRNELPDRVVVL
ncbi:putative membrane protein [Actimicrobium sp. GrIS 1.19]|uniref:TPM domain-containing protein n=1 Tax=Actimicrobium sp. GrIS 1.19 TaxID=3071708 RepID=UPI002DFA7ECD|nr:putative membrane protein [Actimicrobium sp. GrIS 1.19]